MTYVLTFYIQVLNVKNKITSNGIKVGFRFHYSLIKPSTLVMNEFNSINKNNSTTHGVRMK